MIVTNLFMICYRKYEILKKCTTVIFLVFMSMQINLPV